MSRKVLILIIGITIVLKAGTGGAEAVPPEARAVAQAYLDHTVAKCENEPAYFEEIWGTVFKGELPGIHLGRHYRIYLMTREQIEEYAASSDLLPTKYWRLSQYAFPVLSGEEDYLETIKVIELEGVWSYLGSTLARGNTFDPWLVNRPGFSGDLVT